MNRFFFNILEVNLSYLPNPSVVELSLTRKVLGVKFKIMC
jgi:hypothetical protein